jgi:hypothetical protein
MQKSVGQMTKCVNPSEHWIVPFTGVALVTAGGVQLMYATFMIVLAFGAAAVDLGTILLQGVAQIGSHDPEITGSDAAHAVANGALNIGIYGLALGAIALVIGILTLVKRGLALYGVLAIVAICALLAVFHWSLGWYVGTAIYAAFALLFTGSCIYDWVVRSSPAQRSTLLKDV